jgi:hypothetical protein
MDDLKPAASADVDLAVAPATEEVTPEALAKRFFVITMLGMLGYVTAILVLMSASD